MIDENSGDKKSKGVDISTFSVEMGDEDRAPADERLREQFKEL